MSLVEECPRSLNNLCFLRAVMFSHMNSLSLFLQPVLKILQVLDLGENLLGNDGIRVIREALMANRSLLQLGLTNTNLTCEGTILYGRYTYFRF